MSEFKREARYIVIKLADLNKLRGGQTEALRQELAKVSRRLPKRECVVIESDWPEYNFVWLMLEHRMAGFPVPDFNAVKCAADVAVAEQRLADAERRNAVYAELLVDLRSLLEPMQMPNAVGKIDAALNPNPEAASHER